MHVLNETQQIRYRRVLGEKAGLQDTLSLKRFGLSDRDFGRLCRNVESMLQAQRTDVEHLRAIHDWLETIPRKLREYLLDRLLSDDRQFVVNQVIDLQESIDAYEIFRQGSETSAKTDAIVMHDVERLLERCPSDVTRIDVGVLQDLLAELEDDHDYAPNTLARHAKHWSAFFAWLIGRGVIASNPCATLPKEIATRAKDEVRSEWIDAMVAKCSIDEERYWLRLLQWTGCRLREGLQLRVRDFDLAKGRIEITETKNDRIRVNPIYPAIAEYLDRVIAKRDPDERVLAKITENTCYDWLAELQHAAGVAIWQPPYNAFRATRANQLAADRSISPQQAGLLLGHSATVARRSYLSVDDSLLERLAS